MKSSLSFAIALSITGIGMAAAYAASGEPQSDNASPIYGVALPEGYRDWKFIAPAQEAPPLDELRAVLANDVAVDAYKNGTLPFPDGSVIVKLAYKRQQSTEFPPATVPGAPTTVQVMVEDSKKFPTAMAGALAAF
jgi:hypothetical protein